MNILHQLFYGPGFPLGQGRVDWEQSQIVDVFVTVSGSGSLEPYFYELYVDDIFFTKSLDKN